MRKRPFLLLFVLAVAMTLASTSPASAATVHIAVGPGNSFSPKTPTINVNDTVTWTLAGGSHNVNADGGLFRSGEVSSSWSPYSFTFTSPGTFGYHCELHGSPGSAMFGTITVVAGGNPGTLQFNTASTSAAENGGNKTITVTRTGGDDGPVSVEYETVDGSATQPTDYTQTNDTLTWADNDDNSKTFQVPIINDGTEEPSQSFTIRLSNPGGGAILGGNDTITVTINDDDEPSGGGAGTIRFTTTSASPTVGEGAASVTLTAERLNGSTGPVTATVNTADGSATAGTDYQAISNGTVSWSNGDTANKTVVIPIVGDTLEEPNETFTATLSAPTGGATIGNIPTSTVTITDDDTSCEPCVADETTLCLAAGSGEPSRFRLRVTWTDFAGGTGPGRAVPFSGDSGFFYFFNPNNLELLVKMVRGCGTALDAYWFFYAAASNVGLEYELRDTVACVTKTYSNPLGNFASDGDINALATCP